MKAKPARSQPYFALTPILGCFSPVTNSVTNRSSNASSQTPPDAAISLYATYILTACPPTSWPGSRLISVRSEVQLLAGPLPQLRTLQRFQRCGVLRFGDPDLAPCQTQ